MNVKLFPTAAELGGAAAARGAAVLRDVTAGRGSAAAVIATGASQFAVPAALVEQADLDWFKVSGFLLDRYLGLPATHPASFRRYLRERFVSKVPPAAFHESHGEAAGPAEECRRVGDLLTAEPIDVAPVGNGHPAFAARRPIARRPHPV